MAIEKTMKDLHEIYARLLDHRPVLNGEINFFLKEFEEKHGTKAVEELQSTQQKIDDMSNSLIPDSVQIMEKQFSDITGKLNVSIQMCNKISEKETEHNQADHLQEQRAQRLKAWETFMSEMVVKSAAVDTDFEKDVEELKKHYAELEEKLRITT